MSGGGATRDRYRRIRELGSGAGGRVWLVEDRLHPGSRVALKEPSVSDGPERRRQSERLLREYATLSTLHHPGIVQVHEIERDFRSATTRFTLEHVAGTDIVTAVSRLGAPLLPALAVEALRALGFLHRFDVLYGDFKPANLLVRERPRSGARVVLVDFGMAIRRERGMPDARRAGGTLPYLAPELFDGVAPSRRSDLYGLGAVLHEAAYGRPPVALDDEEVSRFLEAARAGRRSRVTPPAGLPGGFAEWLEPMLAPGPEGRPATAEEALSRLADAVGADCAGETRIDRIARLRSGRPADRGVETEHLCRLLLDSRGPRVVWLRGGPGSGKSRVLRWLGARFRAEGWEVWGPDLVGDPPLELLREVAGKAPGALLLLDDVDDAGRPTLDLLERVAREPGRPPLAVVAALRPGATRHPRLQGLLDGTDTVPTLSAVDLAPLQEPALRELASRATGGAVSDERVRWLRETSEGHAAVAAALLADGVWELGERERPETRILPHAAVTLASLTPAERSWLEALAVAGEGAADELLAELAGLDPAAAGLAATAVGAAGLVRRVAGHWKADSRAWMQGLLEAMEPDRRRALHRNAALGVGKGADPALLSRLWDGAGERRHAAAWAVRAARRARLGGDAARAARWWEEALRRIPRDDAARRRMRMRLGDARARSGLFAAAARSYGAAHGLARDRSQRLAALTAQADALVRSGRFGRALAVTERAADLLDPDGDPRLRARIELARGVVLARLGRADEAAGLLAGALGSFDLRPLERAEVLQTLAACRLRLGEDAAAENAFREAVELHRSQRADGPPLPSELKARIGLAVIEARARRHERVEAILEEVRREARRLGHLDVEEAALARLSSAAVDRGELDRAIDLAEQAVDLARHLGDANLVLVDRCRLADARIRCGRAGEAVALLREALRGRDDRVEPESIDYARMLLADALMESRGGDDGAAAELLAGVLGSCRRRRPGRALMMALVIELERRAMPGCAEAPESIAAELDRLSRAGPGGIDPEIRIRGALARAQISLARGSLEESRRAAESAARVSREAAAPAFEARALAVGARALLRAGRGEEAGEASRRARELLSRAASRIRDERVRRDFQARPVFEPLREDGAALEPAVDGRLAALYDMIRVLNSESDPDALLESILDMALGAVRAERGMILLRDGEDAPAEAEFAIRLARNLERETVEDVESYSRSLVREAGRGRSVMTVDAGNDARFRDLRSVSLYGIRSLMCVPLRSRGAIVGVVYLDSRSDGALFSERDLRFVEAFADHAAIALQNARTRDGLERRMRRLEALAEKRTEFANIVGRSPGMQAVFDLIAKVAASDLPVVVRGESGTGKELVAKAIHFQGARRRGPFVSENCAAIPETLLESELFGHVRGAFTGADRDRAGLFELARGGTLFLDEIGDMPTAMQTRLLRVLEERAVRRVGGERKLPVDVRLLTATHRDLDAAVAAGTFREDLLYRVRVLAIELPPLRERSGDVALLTARFLERIAAERGRPRWEITAEVLSLFERHRWPGNVRELENALQRLTLLAGDGPIDIPLIESDPVLRGALLGPGAAAGAVLSLASGERRQIERALSESGGDRRRAAALLGISRSSFYRKLKRHGIRPGRRSPR